MPGEENRGDSGPLTLDFNVMKPRRLLPPFSKQKLHKHRFGATAAENARNTAEWTPGRPLWLVNFKGVFPDLFCGAPQPCSLAVYDAVTIQLWQNVLLTNPARVHTTGLSPSYGHP